VGDLNLFVKELKPQSRLEYLLNKVTTLRLYHPVDYDPDEPPYVELFNDGKWKSNGMKAGIRDHQGLVYRAKEDKDYADKLYGRAAVDKLVQTMAIKDLNLDRSVNEIDDAAFVGSLVLEDQPFANLERVVMGGVGQKWTAKWSDLTLGITYQLSDVAGGKGRFRPRRLDSRPIPHFLLALGRVQHYCQYLRTGPLSFNWRFVCPIISPQIVTHHLPEAEESDYHLPPVVIGSVNRFMFSSPRDKFSHYYGHNVVEMGINLANTLINENPRAICLYPNGYQFTPLENVDVDTTTVELYGFCHQGSLINPPLRVKAIPTVRTAWRSSKRSLTRPSRNDFHGRARLF